MAATAKSEESALKVMEEAGSRAEVTEDEIHGAGPHQGKRPPFASQPSALLELLPGPLTFYLTPAFPLQVSSGQAALITCHMELPFLKPL